MVDLTKWTRVDLIELKAQVAERLIQVEAEERNKALAAAEAATREFGFTLKDLLRATQPVKKTGGPAKKAGVARYANPADKSQTWTGRGRRPAWFKAALKAGAPPEQLEV
jgi:DNA-binding protein H-NS